MSQHTAIIRWQRTGPDFVKGKYSREHTWSFDGGLTVPASPAPVGWRALRCALCALCGSFLARPSLTVGIRGRAPVAICRPLRGNPSANGPSERVAKAQLFGRIARRRG